MATTTCSEKASVKREGEEVVECSRIYLHYSSTAYGKHDECWDMQRNFEECERVGHSLLNRRGPKGTVKSRELGVSLFQSALQP